MNFLFLFHDEDGAIRIHDRRHFEMTRSQGNSRALATISVYDQEFPVLSY